MITIVYVYFYTGLERQVQIDVDTIGNYIEFKPYYAIYNIDKNDTLTLTIIETLKIGTVWRAGSAIVSSNDSGWENNVR